jgi:hypothetical protein
LHTDAAARREAGRAGLALVKTSFSASCVVKSLKTAIDSQNPPVQLAAAPTKHAVAVVSSLEAISESVRNG